MSEEQLNGAEDTRPGAATPQAAPGGGVEETAEFSRWQEVFPAADQTLLKSSFERWSQLSAKSRALERLTENSGLPVGGARQELELANKKLRYDAPFRVVVLGRTGVGKSSFINALLRRRSLAAGPGGAVTGIPTHISLIPDEGEERVVVTYRTEPEFRDLLLRLARRYNLKTGSGNGGDADFPASMEEVAAFVRSNKLTEMIARSSVEPKRRQQLAEEFDDIVGAWGRIAQAQRLGWKPEYNPAHELDKVHQLVEESIGPNARDSAAREIPGIAKVEYFLKGHDGVDERSLRNAVIVDAPGLGAETLRHRELLQAEMEKADAVILIVSAERPEGELGDTADLIRDNLFAELDAQRQVELARKMFLVVNKIELIRSPVSRARLEENVRKIYRSIYPAAGDAELKSVKDQQYFETAAGLGFFAYLSRTGQQLDVVEATDYESLLIKAGVKGDPSNGETHEKALAASRMPVVESRLVNFLARERIDVMLREADRRLSSAAEAMREECLQVLRRHELPVDDAALDPAFEADRFMRQLSRQLLEEDRRALFDAARAFQLRLHSWRLSDAHQQELEERVQSVYEGLRAAVSRRLYELMDEAQGFFGVTMDDVTGISYKEARYRGLILELEHTLRLEIARVAGRLADYYTEQFNSTLSSQDVYGLLQEKAYGQPYIDSSVRPSAKLQQSQQEVGGHFKEICAWTLLYELIRRPLLGRVEQLSKGYRVWEVMKKFIPAIVNGGIEATLPAFGAPPGSSSFLQTIIQPLTDPAQPPQPRPVAAPITRGEVDIAGQERGFIEALDKALGSGENGRERVEALMMEQFSARFRAAVTAALPFVEDLFFFEVGRYRRAFEVVATSVWTEHLERLSSDEGAHLRQALMQNNQGVWREVSEATSTLRALKDLA